MTPPIDEENCSKRNHDPEQLISYRPVTIPFGAVSLSGAWIFVVAGPTPCVAGGVDLAVRPSTAASRARRPTVMRSAASSWRVHALKGAPIMW
jgi:hypothetical protein